MYAKPKTTTWDLQRPTSSTFEDGHTFDHEDSCPLQHTVDPTACTCYVSRIRLVKTPVGETIATTEPDLRALGKFWHNEAERLQRSNKVLTICLLVSAASGIATAIGLASELGVL